MKTVKGEVLLFRAPTDDIDGDYDPYRTKLEEAGLRTKNVTVLDFEYCNLHVLEQKIKNPSLFSGLVFTSPRAVRAVACIKDAKSLLGGWQNHPVFVVGEGTSNVLKKLLHLNGKGSTTGNASALADEIFQSKYEHPLLFPCGNLKRDELSTKLSSKHIRVIAVTVYQTHVHPQLEQRLDEIVLQNSGFPETVVYFSPSGMKYTIPILEKMQVPLHQLKV
ncbi:uroporphyrinogen-III synthase-like isoform X2 [Zootermopsis nevadensis]|uniref:uroporphyrinogen-III synthase-like isoform X2 n=1 Tax=Zootermopsis nevadensis TaxID=136037 RepID=UPI000B8EC5F6|nr:uroporphyrinogen-III synthase-like isoform X2 [Zootermopsis nevadensis]